MPVYATERINPASEINRGDLSTYSSSERLHTYLEGERGVKQNPHVFVRSYVVLHHCMHETRQRAHKGHGDSSKPTTHRSVG